MKNISHILVFVMGLHIVFSHSYAAESVNINDGNSLYGDYLHYKKEGANFRGALFIGYIVGFEHGTYAASPPVFCKPENATYGQSFDVVGRYLENNPESRHEFKAVLVLKALQQAWPCSPRK